MYLRRIVTALALAAVFTGVVQADPTGLGIEVTPAKLDAELEPGQLVNLPLTVHNGGIDVQHVQASMVDFDLSPTGQYRFVRTGTLPDSLLKYASIRPREFDLPPGTSQQVQLTIQLPKAHSLSGELAGIVFFQTRPTRHAGQNVALSVRVASKLYIAIPNTVKLDGAITKMTAETTSSGQTYRVSFKNNGNAHVYLRGELLVQRGGALAERIPIPENLLVERGQTRTIEVNGKKLAAGQYQAIATIDYGGKTETGGAIAVDVR